MSFENWTIEDLIARCADFDEMTLEMNREEFAALRRKITELKQAGNSPVIGIDLASGPDRSVEVRYVAPPGYVMVPKEPTAEMQSAGASAIRIETTAVNKLWTGNAVFRAMLAAADSGIPIISDTWIPVSERMPDETQPVIVVSEGGVVQRTIYQFCEGVWSDWYDLYDDVNVEAFTHWMPLPAAPAGGER